MQNQPEANNPLPVLRTLDVRAHFNPIDCRSLSMIRRELREMPAKTVLLVMANRFQQREIEAWCGKVRHKVLSMEHDREDDDLTRIYVENSGVK
jgi:TusA-related sulfurtransferase